MLSTSDLHVESAGYTCACGACAGGAGTSPASTSGGGATPAAAPAGPAGPSGNPDIDGLLIGVEWSTSNLTFSFPTSAAFYDYNFNGELNTFGALSAAAQAAVRGGILPMFAAVANVTFTEVTETASVHADLRYADTDATQTAWAYYPATEGWGGDVWVRKSGEYGALYNSPVKGNYAWTTYLHETGHAMGLKHGHETDVYGALPLAHDSMEYSVMTYKSYVGGPTDGYTNEDWGFAQTLMMLDVAALQYLYGANFNTNSANSVYSWSPTTGQMFINGVGQGAPGGNRVFMNIWDGGGVDTFDFSSYTTNLQVNLNPGEWVNLGTQLANLDAFEPGHMARGNISNSLLYQGDTRSLIENAIGGSGNDTIVGNQANNWLTGGLGNDTLSGNAGDDTLDGGAGTDQLSGGVGNNWLIGGTGNDTIMGGADLDWIEGGAGSDTINGGGGHGHAIYWSSNAAVTINLATGLATGGHASGDTLLNIMALSGSAFADNLTGNVADNWIDGGSGDDTLDGGAGNDQLFGGTGNNWLIGGAGNDTIIGGASLDWIEGGAGADSIDGGGGHGHAIYWSSDAAVTINLTTGLITGGHATGDNLLNITALSGSSYADSLTGNAADNWIDGGAGDDVIKGGAGNDQLFGGAGNNWLAGGAGDDTLIGGVGLDWLQGGAGADSIDGGGGHGHAIYSSSDAAVAVNLAAGSAMGGHATGDVLLNITALSGSNYADSLTGDAGDNWIDGGVGDDILTGGAGADSFVFAAGWGADILEDWANGEDLFDMTALASQGVHGADNLTIQVQGTDTIIAFGGNTIWLHGFSGALDTSNWLFV